MRKTVAFFHFKANAAHKKFCTKKENIAINNNYFFSTKL